MNETTNTLEASEEFYQDEVSRLTTAGVLRAARAASSFESTTRLFLALARWYGAPESDDGLDDVEAEGLHREFARSFARNDPRRPRADPDPGEFFQDELSALDAPQVLKASKAAGAFDSTTGFILALAASERDPGAERILREFAREFARHEAGTI